MACNALKKHKKGKKQKKGVTINLSLYWERLSAA